MSNLYGLPDKKTFNGKIFKRLGIYTNKPDANRDARRYTEEGYHTRIVNVPKNQPYQILWKCGLYVRRK